MTMQNDAKWNTNHEHQLPHLISASHTTPTTRVNLHPKKLVGWRHCPYFMLVPYILGTRPRCLALNQALPPGSQ